MRRVPMPRNIDATAYPDVVVPLDVIQKTLQGADPSWPPEQPAVHADAHHFGAVQAGGVPFCVERIKGIAHIVEERIGM